MTEWTKEHITVEKIDGVVHFIAWDEAGQELFCSTDRSKCIDALVARDEFMRKSKNDFELDGH